MSERKLLIFDFFSGTGSSTQAFKDAGHTVISFENDSFFEATELIDVFELTAKRLLVEYGRPDFIWASPPCTAFSVASMGHHWINGGANPMPRTEAAAKAQDLVLHTLHLINDLNPPLGWLSAGIASPTGYLMLNTSEYPNAAVECSLSEVLETQGAHLKKYSLSPKAAQGILRRANRREKTLPVQLEQALQHLANQDSQNTPKE